MSCVCTATILQEIAELKAMVHDLHQTRKDGDDLPGQPFSMSKKYEKRAAASIADQARKQERKRLRQSGN